MAARPRITISTLRERKRDQRRFSMITCYDYATARIIEESGIDSVLVGDTYAEVCLGHATTLPARLDHMVTLAEAVRRGAPSAYLVGDMPFLSYQTSRRDAVVNAGRFMAEAGCDCVKVEVDRRLLKTVEAMATASIPVMAHLGLKPQAVQSVGGYRIQGRKAADALAIVEDARLMEEAGAVALLLEAVSTEVAAAVTQSTALPVIGIASGPHCDGQVVVLHDMLGYGGGHPPQSVKQYAQLYDIMINAFRSYADEVSRGVFPSPDAGAHMDSVEAGELRRLLQLVQPGEKRTGEP